MQYSVITYALSLAIVHSLWQSAFLWLMYKLITVSNNNNQSASFRHFAGMMLLVLGFVGFVGTFFWIIYTPPIFNEWSLLQYLQTEGLSLFQPNIKLATALSSLYLIGLLFCFIRVFYQYKQLPKPLPKLKAGKLPELKIFTENWANRIGIKQKIGLILSEKVDVPQVLGHLKPIIYIPIGLINHLSTKQLELIILHELTHIKRNDYLANLFQSFLESVLFFNPFIHLISAKIRLEREKACDETILNFPYPRKEYAEALFVTESFRQQKVRLALAASGDKKQLLQRIKHIMTSSASSQFNGQKKWVFSILITCLAFTFYILTISNHAVKAKNSDISSNFTNSLLPYLPIQQAFYNSKTSNTKKQNATKLPAEVKSDNNKKQYNFTAKTSRKAAHLPLQTTAETGTIALINEDLLNGTAFSPSSEAYPIAAIEGTTNEDWLVKVEEEVSGSTQKRTTYYKVEMKNGQQQLTPLFITAPIKKTSAKAKAQH